MRGILSVCAVKAPGYGDRRKAILGDLATVTGGTAIFKDLGIPLDSVKLSDLGRAKKLIITSEETTDGQRRRQEGSDRRPGRTRFAAKSNRPTATTTVRSCKSGWRNWPAAWRRLTRRGHRNRNERTQGSAGRAKAATQAALEEGIVPGGGVALIRAEKVLDEWKQRGTNITASKSFVRCSTIRCEPSPKTPAMTARSWSIEYGK